MLRFGPNLTVVYGDNAAGKTGYIRILKSACRGRGPERKERSAVEVHFIDLCRLLEAGTSTVAKGRPFVSYEAPHLSGPAARVPTSYPMCWQASR